MPTKPLLLNPNPIRPNFNLVFVLVAPLQGVMIREKELSVSHLVSHLDPFSRLDVSVTFQQCPSKARTLFIEAQSDSTQNDLEEISMTLKEMSGKMSLVMIPLYDVF